MPLESKASSTLFFRNASSLRLVVGTYGWSHSSVQRRTYPRSSPSFEYLLSLNFMQNIKKSDEPKSWEKCCSNGQIGPFWPNIWQARIFPKNSALSVLSTYGSSTWCKISTNKKTNEPILRKILWWKLDVRTYGQIKGPSQSLVPNRCPPLIWSICQKLIFSEIIFQKRSIFCYNLTFPSICFLEEKPRDFFGNHNTLSGGKTRGKVTNFWR